MNNDLHMGLGPYVLTLPAVNKTIASIPPTDQDWELILKTIRLIQRYNKRKAAKPEPWTDGTF
jgi:hypothetical protein